MGVEERKEEKDPAIKADLETRSKREDMVGCQAFGTVKKFRKMDLGKSVGDDCLADCRSIISSFRRSVQEGSHAELYTAKTINQK